MFGYILPSREKLIPCDFSLYRSFYCGLCKNMGKHYNQISRYTINYDITLLSILVSGFLGAETEFVKCGCILNPFFKKPTAMKNPLFDKLLATNIILSYYKALDGVIDKEGFKYKLAKRILKKPYKKAVAVFPEVDLVVRTGFEKLRKLEKENCDSIDRVADCFAMMLKQLTLTFLRGSEATEATKTSVEDFLALSYNIGKFVYLVDALDDIEQDFKKKRYNPFLSGLKRFTNRQEYITLNKSELEFSLYAVINRTIECFNNIRHRFTIGERLLENIFYYGLKEKVQELFASKKKLKKPWPNRRQPRVKKAGETFWISRS